MKVNAVTGVTQKGKCKSKRRPPGDHYPQTSYCYTHPYSLQPLITGQWAWWSCSNSPTLSAVLLTPQVCQTVKVVANHFPVVAHKARGNIFAQKWLLQVRFCLKSYTREHHSLTPAHVDLCVCVCGGSFALAFVTVCRCTLTILALKWPWASSPTKVSFLGCDLWRRCFFTPSMAFI